MTKTIRIGSVSIPLDSYAINGTALLGIKESGKTYTAKSIAEQLLEHGIPIIVFDAIGVWRYLKVAGDGPKAKGFKIVVAGGKEPDLPLTPQSAPEIVRAAIRENIPLVIDLYDKKLSKADWRKIVQASFRTLLYENEGLRHIFLEETAEYAPQKVFDGETYAEVEKLVRMGGNASLGITLINQRAQEVNKAVLDLCENMLLLRQRGAHAIDNLEKWMDRISPTVSKQIAAEMPNMRQGDCWVFTGSSELPVRTRSDVIKSFHPDRRKPAARAAAKASADTGEFVQRLSGELAKVFEEHKANDPAELKRRIRELEKQLAAKPAPGLSAQELSDLQKEAWADGQRTGFDDGANHGYKCGWDAHADALANAIAGLPKHPPVLGDALIASGRTVQKRAPTIPRNIPVARSTPVKTPVSPGVKRTNGSGEQLPKGEAATLTACIQFPDGLKREQLTVLTGYKRSSRDAYIQRLREKGYVDTSGDRVTATDAGIAAMPDAEPLPTGEALQEYWLQRLPEGERKVLEVLIAAHPHPVERSSIDEQTGYQRSSRDAYLQRLRAKQLIAEPSRGLVQASGELF